MEIRTTKQIPINQTIFWLLAHSHPMNAKQTKIPHHIVTAPTSVLTDPATKIVVRGFALWYRRSAMYGLVFGELRKAATKR
jgi:hypothetical protein